MNVAVDEALRHDGAAPTDLGRTRPDAEARGRQPVKTTIAGLAIGLAGPFVAAVVVWLLSPLDLFGSLAVRAAFGLTWQCAVAAALILFVLRVEHRPLRSVGFRRPRWTEIATTPLWWFLGMAITLTLVAPIRDIVDVEPARMITDLPLWVRCMLVVVAPLTEELFFRGYAIERLAELTGRMWLAATITTVTFAAMHIPYYGFLPGAIRLPVSALLAIRYLRRRSLAPPIALHFAIDLPVVFV